MQNRLAPRQTPVSPGTSIVVHWEFTRGRERLCCQVARDGQSGAFAVMVIVYRDLHRASVETFQAAAPALRRHAMLAANLRASGWTLAAYTV
jgi:hypothetical protein